MAMMQQLSSKVLKHLQSLNLWLEKISEVFIDLKGEKKEAISEIWDKSSEYKKWDYLLQVYWFCDCSLQHQSCFLKNTHYVLNAQQTLHFWPWEKVCMDWVLSPGSSFLSLSLKLFPAIIQNGCLLVNLYRYSNW